MNAIEQIFGATNTGSAAKPNKELGQEDFLKLLVAQLKNQDPNNPADNGEFLGQIAQFSMVSGIDDLGVAFEGVAGSLYTNQAMQAAQLVGKDVLVESNTGTLNAEESIQGFLEFDNPASNVRLQIHDASGALVKFVDLGNTSEGMHEFDWNGIDEEGNRLPPAEYQLTAAALVGGELQAVPVHIFSRVESVSVDRNNTSISLNLTSKESVGFSQIREYR